MRRVCLGQRMEQVKALSRDVDSVKDIHILHEYHQIECCEHPRKDKESKLYHVESA